MAFPHNPQMPKSYVRKTESMTHPYWQSDKIFRPTRTLQSYDHHLGFTIEKPWPLPTMKAIYNGDNAIPGSRDLVFTQYTTPVAVGNVLPQTGGYPLVKPQDLDFRREKYVHRI